MSFSLRQRIHPDYLLMQNGFLASFLVICKSTLVEMIAK